MASQQSWDSHPSLIPKNALAVDLTQYEWTNSQLVFDFTLKCFYLSRNLVYFSRSAPPPDHPRHVYIGDDKVFRSDWTNLLSASRGKQLLINQEAVAKQTEAIKGYTPLPLQHHETYPSGYYYDSVTRYTYHVTPSSQAILCQDTHPFTKLIDVPLRLMEYLDPVEEYQQPELSMPPHEITRWRFTRLQSPQVATSSTPKAEISLSLTRTPEIEYQSVLLTAEPEEPTDPSSSNSDSDSDTDSMAGDKETKMNPPPEFSGSAEKARDFLWQADLYITCKKDQFKDDTTCIVWTF